MSLSSPDLLRHDWTKQEIAALFELPFLELLYQAQTIHRQHFKANAVQNCTLMSIKTGACPEDCNYCSQSGHHNAELEKQKLSALEEVIESAKEAKANGASRFCMGAAWRGPRSKDFPQVLAMIKAVKALGLESCVTLGMLTDEQTQQLADVGLDYYNHNLDTSPEYYEKVTSTRTYQDRLDTIERVREAGIHVCCGGIVGMGETREDRVSFLHQLATLPKHPESVPINKLIAVKGTPFEDKPEIPTIEFVRTIAVARILMPKSFVRLSAGRENMNAETHALCFMAGANSLFLGDKLLTTANADINFDQQLFQELGIEPLTAEESVAV